MQEIFEHAFGTFLETEVYDKAEDALFRLVRAAFYAGWTAAGGTPLPGVSHREETMCTDENSRN